MGSGRWSRRTGLEKGPASRGGPDPTCHIGDFTRWKEHDAYQKALDRLLRDMRVEQA